MSNEALNHQEVFMSGRVSKGKTRFTQFIEDGERLERERSEAIQRLSKAGHHAEAYPLSPGGIWVGKNLYLNTAEALRAHRLK